MALDTRMGLLTSEEILEKTHREGHLPKGATPKMLHFRSARTVQDLGYSPMLDVSREEFGKRKWDQGRNRSIKSGGQTLWVPGECRLDREADGTEVLKVTDGKSGVEVCRTKILWKGRMMQADIPVVAGSYLGILGRDGRRETAPIQDPETTAIVFSVLCPWALSTPLLKKGVVPPPPMEDCTDPSWWPEEVRQLSSKTSSLLAANTALMCRRPRKQTMYTFSGKLPDGTTVTKWTAEMLLSRMTAYEFMPFMVMVRATLDETQERPCMFNLRIPAFSEEQARTIMMKRVYEWGKLLYRGNMMYSREALQEMGYSERQADWWTKHYSGIIRKAPPLTAIPVFKKSRALVTDFFLLNENHVYYTQRLFDESKTSAEIRSNQIDATPFDSGWWTSDDLGFAFAHLFAGELGLKPDVYCPQNGIFATPPLY